MGSVGAYAWSMAIGDGAFHKGQPIWVRQADGSAREGVYVGEGETSAWFGGPPTVYVVYPDSESGEAVAFDRITAREDN
ncbi:MAG: hypothetical protein QOH11_1346 [Solirubrobacteraceae bacterium]|nr:hypothetical protein [Solirubrobacteraceae bacterium]